MAQGESKAAEEAGSGALEGLGGLGADEAMWPEVRSALASAASAACSTASGVEFPKAKARAKLCGLWERALADPRWAAQGMLEAPFDGRDESLRVLAEACHEMGLSWGAVAPWVLEGWMSQAEDALARHEDPLMGDRRETPPQDHLWTWMVGSLKMLERGWSGAAGGKPAPLSGAWRARIEGVAEELWRRSGPIDGVPKAKIRRLFMQIPELGGLQGMEARFEAKRIAEAAGPGKKPGRAARI